MSKLKLIVVRWNGTRFTMSKPCKHCIEFIKTTGIKKIYYSDDSGNLVYEHIRDIESNHISMYHQQFG